MPIQLGTKQLQRSTSFAQVSHLENNLGYGKC